MPALFFLTYRFCFFVLPKPLPHADPDHHLLYFPGKAFLKYWHYAMRQDH